MASEALEQKVSDNRYNELRLLDTIDVYAESTAVLYTPPMVGSLGLTPFDAGFNTTDNGIRPMPWEHRSVLEEYGTGRYGNKLPEERQTTLSDYGIGNTGFGEEFGAKTGYVYDRLNVDGNDLLLRIRPDTPHPGAEYEHLNLETLYIDGKRRPPITNQHEPFNWKPFDWMKFMLEK